MNSRGQVQQPEEPEKPRLPSSIVIAVIFGLVALCCFVASLTLFILNNFNLLKLPSPNILTAVFNTLGAAMGILSMASAVLSKFFRWILSYLRLETNRTPVASTAFYNTLSSLPPPIEPGAILQRDEIIKQIYAML